MCLLRSRQLLSTLGLSPSSKRVRVDDSTAAALLLFYERQCDALYAQTAAAYSSAGFDKATGNPIGHDARVRSDAGGHIFMEFVQVTLFPFDHVLTSATMWKCVTVPRGTLARGYAYEVGLVWAVWPVLESKRLTLLMVVGLNQSTTLSDDVVRMQTSVVLRVHQRDVQHKRDVLMKRFVEADRTVLVWCSIEETKDTGVLDGRQLRMQESGWSVLERGDESGSTTMRALVRLVPEVAEGAADSDELQPGVLSDEFLTAHLQCMMCMTQNLENNLLVHVDTAQV